MAPFSDKQNLAEFGCTKGRVADEEDVREGNAAFVSIDQSGKHIGEPMDIQIPQYCVHTDDETGTRSVRVLIQAERIDDKEYCGLVDIDRSESFVCTKPELHLCGSEFPVWL